MNYKLNLPNGTSIEIASNDYALEMIQREECNLLGSKDGWRLPSILELKLIFHNLHKEGNGNFHTDWYWSNDFFEVSWDYSLRMGFNFNDGATNAEELGFGSRSYGLSKSYVRLVRHLTIN
mgnify:CR=1 FL=1